MQKTKPNNGAKATIFFAVIVAILTIALRLYKIAIPLADFHSWRQADTASVSRNYAADGINLLKPKYDDLSNIQSGLVNPQGYRMVEFPLYNAGITILNSTKACSVEVCGRVLSVFAAVVTALIIFYLLFKENGLMAAVWVVFMRSPFLCSLPA